MPGGLVSSLIRTLVASPATAPIVSVRVYVRVSLGLSRTSIRLEMLHTSAAPAPAGHAAATARDATSARKIVFATRASI